MTRMLLTLLALTAGLMAQPATPPPAAVRPTFISDGRPVEHDAALDAHHAACTAIALPYSTLHDHRHHFAVAALKRGAGYAFVDHQLGHHNTMLAQQRYGRYVPSAEELHRGALAESGRAAWKTRAVAHVFAQVQDQPEA
jgi:integrase